MALAFGPMLLAGGILSTATSGQAVHDAIIRSAASRAQQIAQDLAREIEPGVESGDWAVVRAVLAAEAQHLAYVFVVRPDGSFVGDPPRDLRRIARSGRLRHRVISNATVVGREKLDGGRGVLWVGLSLAGAHEAALEVERRLLIVTIVAVLFGIAIVILLSSVLTRPIAILESAAARMGGGDLDVRAPTAGPDEIAHLAMSFNEMAGQLRDRIEQAEHLQRYLEQVLDRVPIGIIVADRSSCIRYANGAIGVSFGRVVGRTWEEAIGPTIARDRLELALDRGRPVHVAQSSSEGHAYELAATRLPGPEDEVIVTIADVTELRDLSRRLQQAERLAVAGEVAAGIVHAINNPLDGVARALSLARRTPEDPARVSSMLDLAIEGTDRIATVTRMLLGFARAEAGEARELVLPNRLVEEAASLVRLKADHRGIRLRLDLAASISLVRVEPQGVIEAILNLMLNAVDACRDGGEVVAETRQVDDQAIEIAVSDDGPGIPEKLIGRIFEPFFTTKDGGRGTGLGLSVSRRTVDAYGGEITVQSREGEGSTFRIRLPCEPHSAMGAVAG